MSLPETAVVRLEVGSRVLELEQIADLGGLATASVYAGQPGPYWAYLWPSARALAAVAGELGDRGALRERRVLDLGCGLGAVAVAAAVHGARAVAADLRPEAIELTARNARRCGVEVEGIVLDWNTPPADLGVFDVVFAADVFYEDGMLASVLRFLKRHLAAEGAAYIADPMRVIPSGVAGAARFSGLETESHVLVEGTTMAGGVSLFILRPRVRRRPR